MKQIKIYSDGACSGNPGKGGWGAVIVHGGDTPNTEMYQGYKMTTNNRMELLGVIIPLERMMEEGNKFNVFVYSDSRYVCDAVNKSWVKGWTRNGWMTSNKSPVKNKDLWIRLLALLKHHSVRFIWVKGHDGNPLNEKADLLARNGISSPSLLIDEGYHE